MKRKQKKRLTVFDILAQFGLDRGSATRPRCWSPGFCDLDLLLTSEAPNRRLFAFAFGFKYWYWLKDSVYD
jgi:hypothetical protein